MRIEDGSKLVFLIRARPFLKHISRCVFHGILAGFYRHAGNVVHGVTAALL